MKKKHDRKGAERPFLVHFKRMRAYHPELGDRALVHFKAPSVNVAEDVQWMKQQIKHSPPGGWVSALFEEGDTADLDLPRVLWTWDVVDMSLTFNGWTPVESP